MTIHISDVNDMTTAIDTFNYLQGDIEQSFQRVQHICNSPRYHRQELDQILNHISCTLDDLEQVNQLINSSSIENQSVNILSDQNAPLLLNLNENDSEKSNNPISITNLTKTSFTIGYSKENEERLSSSNTNQTYDERKDFIDRMKKQQEYYKNKIQTLKPENQMETIQLDPIPDDEFTEDQVIRQQDRHIEDIHHTIVSLKNLTQTMNFEINDHIRVLDNLETGMIDNQSRVENLTRQTKNFIRSSGDGVGGHTCLFAIAVGLFFLIVILILFF